MTQCRECDNLSQQWSHHFLFALKNGINALIIVPNEYYAESLYQFISIRAPFAHRLGEHCSELPNITIALTDEAENVSFSDYTSIGISAEVYDHEWDILLTQMKDKPALITELQQTALNRGAFGGSYPKDYPKADCTLKNNEIRSCFMQSFEVAEKRLDIICPWISSSVVNVDLLDRIHRALGRGVMIRIKYGINSSSLDIRSRESDELAAKLEKMFGQTGKFKIIKGNTHIKYLSCDSKFQMIGSYNFLSFAGNYEKDNVRDEFVEVKTNASEIEQNRRRLFSEV